MVQYKVIVDSRWNFRGFKDYEDVVFATRAEAEEACHKVIKRYLIYLLDEDVPNRTAEDLIRLYPVDQAPCIESGPFWPPDISGAPVRYHSQEHLKSCAYELRPLDKPYIVLMDDLWHSRDPLERYEAGKFATLEEAEADCRRRIEEDVARYLEDPNTTAEKALEQFSVGGEEPFIVAVGREQSNFNAFSYFRECAAAMRPGETVESNPSPASKPVSDYRRPSWKKLWRWW